MRASRSVYYAVLGLVAHSPNGIHGYALKRRCERVLGGFWQVNFGEIYRILDNLSDGGLIEQVMTDPTLPRKIYRITDKGRDSLDNFILQPPTDAPRPLRQELAVKLLFAKPAQLSELLDAVDRQRDAYMRQLHLLGAQRRKLRRAPFDSFVTGLLIDGAELSVRAELAWLEEVSGRLKERFGTAGK